MAANTLVRRPRAGLDAPGVYRRRHQPAHDLHFTYSESAFSHFEATPHYLELHGKPQAFYSDQYSVVRVNSKQAAAGDGHTQFGRVLYELNIESICANSS